MNKLISNLDNLLSDLVVDDVFFKSIKEFNYTWAYKNEEHMKENHMANCKFCGRPVRSAKVFHSACWELEVEKALQIFCDDYCRWPDECDDIGEMVQQHCRDCVLVRVLNLGL